MTLPNSVFGPADLAALTQLAAVRFSLEFTLHLSEKMGSFWKNS